MGYIHMNAIECALFHVTIVFQTVEEKRVERDESSGIEKVS